MVGEVKPVLVHHGKTTNFTLFVKAPEDAKQPEVVPLTFTVINHEDPGMTASYETVFNGPKH
jgi:hypothetical protein